MAWKYKIIKLFLKIGLKGRLVLFIKNFLATRTIKVRVGTIQSQNFIVENGVPQSIVIRIYYFLILINTTFEYIPVPISVKLFAVNLNITL